MNGLRANTDMHDMPMGMLYLALILLVGYATVSLLLKPGRRHWLELSGLSFAAGGGVIGLVLFWVSLCRIIPSRWTLSCLALVSIFTLIIRLRSRGVPVPSTPTPRRAFSPATVLAGLAIALILASVCWVSQLSDWPVMENIDAFAIWVLKAKWVAIKPLLPMPAEFRDPTLSFSHQDYPMAFPFLVAGLFKMLGRMEDLPDKYLMMPIYLAIIAMIYGSIRRYHRRAIALTLTALFAAQPNLTNTAGSAVPETFLILVYAGALSMMLSWMETRHRGELLLAGLFVAVLAFTKNEGLALMPVLALVLLCWTLWQAKPGALRDWSAAAGFCLLLLLPWLVYRTFLPRTHEDYGGRLPHLWEIVHNLPRLSYVVQAYLGNLTNLAYVGPIWWLLLVMTVLYPSAIREGPAAVLWSVLLVQLGLYLAAFLVTPWDVHLLVPMVTPRLLSQANPLVILLICFHARAWRVGDPGTTHLQNSGDPINPTLAQAE